MLPDGGAEILGGIQKWRVPCNWKFPAENFSGDSYHNISHRSVDLVGVGPSGSSRRDMPELKLARKLHIAVPDRGHQTTGYLLPQDRVATARLPALLGRCRLFRAIAKRRAAAGAATGDA